MIGKLLYAELPNMSGTGKRVPEVLHARRVWIDTLGPSMLCVYYLELLARDAVSLLTQPL